jgi:hypothetical protein
VRIGTRRWRTPPVNLVEFGAVAVLTLAVGVTEGNVVGKQDVE